MSDAHQKQFEIDLDEIERQLRRSVELPPVVPTAAPASTDPKPDPLAELARIVGQHDPFAGILGDGKTDPASATPGTRAGTTGERGSGRVEPVFAPSPPVLTTEERGVLGSADVPAGIDEPAAPTYFDPVVETYGSAENAVDNEEFEPLAPRRSRRRLAAVMALLVVGVAGAAGALAWRNGSGAFRLSGPPPLIKADNAPLKVAPDNPGGMEIPNQDRQIYERNTKETASRVLDRQEQPIDVREATRSMPQPEVPRTTPSVPDRPAPASRTPSAPAGQPAATGSSQPNAVSSALGEPRRVRTVAVRPDGTTILPTGVSPIPDPTPMMLPGGAPPPPVSVQTMSIPPAMSVPSSIPASGSPGGGVSTSQGGPAIQVLPPQRPRANRATPAVTAAEAPTATRTASAEPFLRAGEIGRTDAGDSHSPPDAPETSADQAPAVRVQPPTRPGRANTRVALAPAPSIIADGTAPATGRGYAVQLATRPTEQAARSAYEQLAEKYATDLGGRPSSIVPAEVNGKSLYRVRVGPLSREDANTLCTRLKSSGGQCFVAAN